MKPAEQGEKIKYRREVKAKRRYRLHPRSNWSHVGADPGELLGEEEFIRAEMPRRKISYRK